MAAKGQDTPCPSTDFPCGLLWELIRHTSQEVFHCLILLEAIQGKVSLLAGSTTGSFVLLPHGPGVFAQLNSIFF